MRILLLLFFAVLFGGEGVGQNLVPNPSFEDTVSCPTAVNEVHNALGWKNYSDLSPDYFNSCTSNSDIDVPNNGGGYQIPASGNAYCAISTFFPNIPNKREIIGRELLANLNIGTKYYFSMKVNLSIDSDASSSYASNKLGVRFSTVPFSSLTPSPINNNAHIWTDSIITDTLNWVTISGSFTADSSYQYIAIGNFFNDSNTDTIKISNDTPIYIWAYYYIDDICVSTDSSYAANYSYTGLFNPEIKNTITLYPNPANDHFYITQDFLESFDLSIYNILGQLLFEEKNINSNYKRININQFSDNLLVVNIKLNNKIFTHKILKH